MIAFRHQPLVDIPPPAMWGLLIRQVSAQGFLVPQFGGKFPQGIQQMAQWLNEGKLTYREDIVDGLENTPEAFIRMLNGENRGKQLVRVS